MTNQEAYKWIYVHFAPCGDETKQDEAISIALEAIAKQIPKKPMKSIDPYNENFYKLYCPTCGKYIACGNSRVGTLNKWTVAPDRCGYCGQKICWEEE